MKKLSLLLLILISLTFIMPKTFSINDVEISLSGTYDLESNYGIGDVIDIPKLNLMVENDILETTIITHMPNGHAVRNMQIELQLPGMHTIEYKALYNNRIVHKKFRFDVTRDAFSFDGSLSTAYYGRPENYGNVQQGIVLELAQGETFHYNQIIDLNNYDDLNYFLEFYAAPKVAGELEARSLNIRLTDVYDSSKYILFRLYSFPADWATDNVYVNARSEAQTLTGMEWTPPENNPNTIQFLDRDVLAPTLIHRNNNFGTSIHLPMDGKGNASFPIVGSRLIQFSFDIEEKALYGGLKSDLKKQLIADFDHPMIFSNLWDGFTTGEVKLSISASEYLKDNLNIVLTNVAGNNLGEDSFSDESAPQISIDYEGLKENIPHGLIHYPYTLFKATAFDDYDGIRKVNTSVYYNYHSDNKVMFEILNNQFIPTINGTYTVIYESTDSSGNIARSYVDIEVSSDHSLDGVLGDYEKNTLVGVPYRLPSFELLGIKGHPSISIKVQHKDLEDVHFDLTGQNAFTPLEIGTYVITYVYSDYIEYKEKTIEIEVYDDGAPTIIGEAHLPKFLIKGATYQLPSLLAMTFDLGMKEEKVTQIFMYSDDSTTPQMVINNQIIVSASHQVIIVYSATGNMEDENNRRYQMAVVNVGYDSSLDMSQYFYGSEVEKQADRDGILLTYQNGIGASTFINPVFSNDFSLIWQIPTDTNEFAAFTITLEDSRNSEQKVKLTYKKSINNQILFSMNDGFETELNMIFGSDTELKITLDMNQSIIYVNNHMGIHIDTYLNGKLFNGFESGQIYMQSNFEDVFGSATVKMINISGQTLNDRNTDLMAPIIQAQNLKGEYEIGTRMTLNPAYALDILDPNTTFSMMVIDPNGNIVTSLNNVLLNEHASPLVKHQFVLSVYGNYKVTYTATDTKAPRPQVFSYELMVVDKTKPEITLEKNYSKTGRIENKVTIADIQISDNVVSELEVYVYLELPNFSLEKIEGNSFVPKQSGVYYIHYIVYDIAGNLSTLSYSVVVSGGNK